MKPTKPKRTPSPPRKSLSPTEWRIMRVCWRRGRTTIADILGDLADEPPVLSFKSVHTLLVRMLDKGYLEIEEEGRRPLYFMPKATRDDVVRAAAEAFVDDLLAGEPENLRILEKVLKERRARAKG